MTFTTLKRTACIAALLSATALTAHAATDAEKIAGAFDGEWLSVTGKVVSLAGEEFTLDYGASNIVVEMDDYDWYNENVMLPGDRVTVTGRMDNDFYENRKIEASSVYVDSLNEFFYASAADEEDGGYAYLIDRAPEDGEWVVMTGEVAEIDGTEMTLDTGILRYRVDADTLNYNPFDRDMLSGVEVGDRVVVSGDMDDADLFDGREIDATSIITLSRAN